MNYSIYAPEWRPYDRVEPERLEAFLEFLIVHPTAMIKHAAEANQIKYQRATALWRKHRAYIETKRFERAINGSYTSEMTRHLTSQLTGQMTGQMHALGAQGDALFHSGEKQVGQASIHFYGNRSDETQASVVHESELK